MKDQCKQAVAKALGKDSLNQQEATDIENRIKDAMRSLAKKDLDTWRNLSDADKLVKAGEFVAQDIQDQLKRKHAIAARDILTQSKNLAALDHPTLSASEVVDRMVAPHGDMSGVQSIDSKARATASIYRGELVDFYTKIKGGTGVFTDKDLVQKIVRERFNDNTGDPLAKQISDKMGEVFEGMRQRFNRSGGDIGKLDDWGLPQTHDLAKIVKAGKEAWVNKAEQLIDTSKYVHEDGSYYSQQQIRELLEYSYDTLSSNGANKTEVGRQSFGGNSKVTSRHSESRVLHFKDADAWLDYQADFGGMPFVDLVEAHINGLSKDIALVENLGSNPKSAMRILMDAAENKDWLNGIEANKTGKSRKRAQTMFDEFMGANTPESEVLANMGLAYRSMNVASMLGGTTLSSIGSKYLREGEHYSCKKLNNAWEITFLESNYIVDFYSKGLWEERFTPEEMEFRREECKTLNEWDSQYQMHAKPIGDVRLDPDKIEAYDCEPVLRRANGQYVLMLGEIRIVGASLKWDPSSGKLKSDVSSVALFFHDDYGNKYWHRALALTGPDVETNENGDIVGGQVWQLCDLVEEFNITKVVIETNGIGGFAPSSLKGALKKRKLQCGVEEQHASQNKNKRILEAIEGPLMSGLLWAHMSVLVKKTLSGEEEDSAVAKQMREWNPAISSQPDDYLDSAAGAIVCQPERVGKIHRTNMPNERPNWRSDSGVVEAALDFD